jgi:small multidrug resistance family-3 protein
MTATVHSICCSCSRASAEAGGGYLMWLWWRDGCAWPVHILDAVVLVPYGITPTYQPAHFGRVDTAYGGVFVVPSVLWGWRVEGIAPDRYDTLGVLNCLVGVAVTMYAVMMYAPLRD